MARREKQDRVHGPYKHRNRWRVVFLRADGRKDVESFESEAEAAGVAAAARIQAEGRTLTYAVDAFEAALRDRGLVFVSQLRARAHLDTILRVSVNGHRPLAWLTPKRAVDLYERVQVGRAVDTHRNSLSVARKFGVWCTKRGWLPANPFADVEPVGKRKRGKAQLHVDEARKLIDTCLAEKSRESLAVALTLLFGMRATEAATRQVRDLDDGGRLIWIPKSKTPAGRRLSEVPEVIRGALVELAGDRPGAAYLFGETDLERPTRQWVYRNTRRLCKAAGVPIVPPHGLRGTHASVATAAGVTSHVVASALGHASAAITESTYVRPGEIEAARTRAALKVIEGGRR